MQWNAQVQPLVTTVIPFPESVTENLRTDASEIFGEVVVRIDNSEFPLEIAVMKNFVGVIEVDEIKMRAEKEGTHSKGFHENIKFLRALNTPASISVIVLPYVF